MDGDGVAAVFEVVALLMGVEGQLALLADGHEAGVQFDGDGGGKDESAGVDAHDAIDLAGLELADEQVDAASEEPRIGQNRGDIFELDARFGEVRDVANGL